MSHLPSTSRSTTNTSSSHPSLLPSQSLHLLTLQLLSSTTSLPTTSPHSHSHSHSNPNSNEGPHSHFHSTSHLTSLTLSSILSRYIFLLGQECVDHATAAGRGKVSVEDVLVVLRDVAGWTIPHDPDLNTYTEQGYELVGPGAGTYLRPVEAGGDGQGVKGEEDLGEEDMAMDLDLGRGGGLGTVGIIGKLRDEEDVLDDGRVILDGMGNLRVRNQDGLPSPSPSHTHLPLEIYEYLPLPSPSFPAMEMPSPVASTSSLLASSSEVGLKRDGMSRGRKRRRSGSGARGDGEGVVADLAGAMGSGEEDEDEDDEDQDVYGPRVGVNGSANGNGKGDGKGKGKAFAAGGAEQVEEGEGEEEEDEGYGGSETEVGFGEGDGDQPRWGVGSVVEVDGRGGADMDTGLDPVAAEKGAPGTNGHSLAPPAPRTRHPSKPQARKQKIFWQDDEPDDPRLAGWLPPLPEQFAHLMMNNNLPTSTPLTGRATTPGTGVGLGPGAASEHPTPSSSQIKLEPVLDRDNDIANEQAVAMERAVTTRREGRSQLDAYVSEPVGYESSSLRFAHAVNGGGIGAGRSHGAETGKEQERLKKMGLSMDQKRFRPPPILPSMLPQTMRAYSELLKEARAPTLSKSSRSYKETAANVILHTTGYAVPFLLAGGTHQIPGRDHVGMEPKGSRYIGGHPVWASSGESVNPLQGVGGGGKDAYPIGDLLGVKTVQTMEPTLSRGLTASAVHADTTSPSLLRTLISELPGPSDPMFESPHFQRSSWLKPSLLKSSTTLLPPGPLKVDASRAEEEGLREGDLALYGEGIRAPGQAASQGQDAKAKAAKEKKAKKLREQVEGTGPKIRFTLGGGGGGSSGNAIDLTGGGKEKDEIVLRATWPVGEDRGDWQTQLELPEEGQAPGDMGNLIAFGYGKRPMTRSAPVDGGEGGPAEAIDVDSVAERLVGIVRYPRHGGPSLPFIKPEPKDGLSERRGLTLKVGSFGGNAPPNRSPTSSAFPTPKITFRMPFSTATGQRTPAERSPVGGAAPLPTPGAGGPSSRANDYWSMPPPRSTPSVTPTGEARSAANGGGPQSPGSGAGDAPSQAMGPPKLKLKFGTGMPRTPAAK